MAQSKFLKRLFMSFARPAKRGCQGRPPRTGVQGCPLIFPLSSRAAAGGEQKESKEVFGDTPNPGKGLPPSALPLLGRTFKNFAPGHGKQNSLAANTSTQKPLLMLC